MTTKSSAPTKSIPPLVIRSAIVASLGGLLFGFDTAVISGAEEKLTELYALSSMGEGMIVAIATIGTICGAIVAGNSPTALAVNPSSSGSASSSAWGHWPRPWRLCPPW